MKKPALEPAINFIALMMIFSFFFPLFSIAQPNLPAGKIANRITELKQKNAFTSEANVFKLSSTPTDNIEITRTVKKYVLLDTPGASDIQRSKPAYISFNIPLDKSGRQVKLFLYKEDISPNGFKLITEKGTVTASQDIIHYRGCIENDPYSVAAFTFSGNEISGLINNQEGNYVIGKTTTAGGEHIVYNDRDLAEQLPFDCAANTFIPVPPVTMARPGEVAAVTTKCVNWYWETDYDMFVNKGSVANVNAYMQAIFNQVATLYANDGITIVLKTLFVWSATDPYTGPNTSDYLTQFGVNRTSFDGDLAHLIGLKGGGGIAWINGACKSTKYKMAYSGISSTYQAVPVFSWSVECITHEQGHLLGSPHTHDCSWNGNNTKIDGCGDAAGYSSGSCAVPALPSGGGTIMSYCHLTSAGINFNLGFGPQPTTLMINTINAASCLVSCNTCTVPAQPGTITGSNTVCSGNTQTYTVAAVSGATAYAWTLPAGWTGTSATNTITVTAGTSGGSISIAAVNSCGNSTAQTLSVTSGTLPVQPGIVTGNTAVCAGTAQTYSVAAVSGAASYTWSIPSGWTGSSVSNTITLTAGNAGGSLSVKANNSCGAGIARTTTLSITSIIPAQPAAISGSTTVCAASSQTYATPAVAGATNYTWVLPTGWSGTSATNSIALTTGTNGGNITVSAGNGCGTSAARSLAVVISPLPTAPAAITVSGGVAAICTGDTRTYTTTLVTGVTYNWTVPAGATIVSGQGTNAIQLNFTSSFVSGSVLSVNAVNGCGSSASTSITISKNSISRPGSISVSGGTAGVCPGDKRTYTVTSVAGITYNWTAPTGSTITSGQGTNSVAITYSSAFTTQGTLTVTANNNCGTSTARSLIINRNQLPTPGTMSGYSTVCPNSVHTYAVPAVAGASAYVWTVPAGTSILGSATGNSLQVRLGAAGGTFTVRAVNACGNSSARSKTVSTSCTAGLEDLFLTNSASVYPNPANQQATLKFFTAEAAACQVSITDMTGRIILTEKIVAVKGVNLHSFNVTRFSKGTYVITILGKSGKEWVKLVIE